MVTLEIILQELRNFRCENSDTLKDIKDDIKEANSRIDNAEKQMVEAEEQLQNIEEATMELLELQKQFESRLTDHEGRARQGNMRNHLVKERAVS